MNASPELIDVLNEILTAELTAINQYFIHSKMCEHWGFDKLAAHNRLESIDEMRDADRLIDRILQLGGHPNMQRMFNIGVGEGVKEQLEVDLALEAAAIERYNRAIAIATNDHDGVTRELLERHLLGEEAHYEWIEKQLLLIESIGIANYLTLQITA